MRLPPPKPPWLLRPLHAWQRRRYGRVLEPTAMWTYRPAAMLSFQWLVARLRGRHSPLTSELRALVALRVSQRTDCAFCIDLNASLLAGAEAPARAASLADWPGSPAFDASERLALEYADAMCDTPPRVSDDLFARLRQAFAPEAIVELTAVVALQNMSARFNAALGITAHGFCTLPARDSAADAGKPPAA
jgi:AhpD family alkylhydroperoxidase